MSRWLFVRNKKGDKRAYNLRLYSLEEAVQRALKGDRHHGIPPMRGHLTWWVGLGIDP